MAEPVYWRCADCDANPVLKSEPVQHTAVCPHVTVPAQVTDAEILEQAREMAVLFRKEQTAPWWRALQRLVVMCERATGEVG